MSETAVKTKPYQWAMPGDVNAFFGLALDNLADLVLTVGLLSTVFDYPAQFALGHLVPGTAVGVVIGDLPSMSCRRLFWLR